MAVRRETWTRIETKVSIETPRNTQRYTTIFVSPGGLFVPTEQTLDPYTQVTVRFSIEKRTIVAHAEVRRNLTAAEALDRGIQRGVGGMEMRIVRMEGDGSQILADHIKKVIMESGGPS